MVIVKRFSFKKKFKQNYQVSKVIEKDGMSAITRNKIQQTHTNGENLKLPKLIKHSKVQTYPFGLPTKEELQNRIGFSIQNDLIPRTLDTFCDSTKDFLKDENQIKNSKLMRTESGKYVFINEYGIVLNKYGPFWPKSHKIVHPLPKFILNSTSFREYYLEKIVNESEPPGIVKVPTLNASVNSVNSQYTAEWRNSILIFDTQKSPRIQDPIIFAQRFSPTLVFESRFESGNLRQARRVGQFEYELLLRTDLFTERHTQWYFFKISNMLANTTYRFRIVNLKKRDSLYNQGLQPLIYSVKQAKENNIGWHRSGHDIAYYPNLEHRSNSLLKRNENYHELDFQLEFPLDKDECYIAHCFPYTYTDLKDDLDALEEKCADLRIMQRDFLCETRAGNTCFLLTITDFNESDLNKVVIVITARVHPGETNSSFMVRGIMDYLTSDDTVAAMLRKKVIFKIIPMLNPDGVIVGNYRCSLAGRDLNRNYRNPQKGMFPTVWHLKDLMFDLKKQYNIFAYFDLHGHSRKSNVFTYGCTDPQQPETELFARVFPWIMANQVPSMFSFENCRYHISRTKESTSRVVMWRQMDIKSCYTLESSFAGSIKLDKPFHFGVRDYENIGKQFCYALYSLIEATENQDILERIYIEITKELMKSMKKPEENQPIETKKEEETETEKPKEQETSPIAENCSSENDCFEIFKKYNEDICYESESSSDSDSESEPEFVPAKKATHKKASQSNNKQKQKQIKLPNNNNKRLMKPIMQTNKSLSTNSFHAVSSLNYQETMIERKLVDHTTKSTNSWLKLGNSTDLSSRDTTHAQIQTHIQNQIPIQIQNQTQSQIQKIPSTPLTHRLDRSNSMMTPREVEMDRNFGNTNALTMRRTQPFINKYSSRTSNGIPIFTLERAEERILKKQKRIDELNAMKFSKSLEGRAIDSMIEEEIEANIDQTMNEDIDEGRIEDNNSNDEETNLNEIQSTRDLQQKIQNPFLKRSRTFMYNMFDIPVYNLSRENTIFSNISENDLKQRKLTGSTIDLKFLNKLDTMTIRKSSKTKTTTTTQQQTKTSITITLPTAESSKKSSDENQTYNSRENSSITEISFLNNSISTEKTFSSNLPTTNLNSHPKIFTNTDPIRNIIKSLRGKNKINDDTNDYMNFLIPNTSLKLP